MRILHLSSEYPPQPVFGLGRYVNELSHAQSGLGNHVTVLTNSFSGAPADTVAGGVKIHRVHFPPPPKAPSTSSMLLHFNLQLVERATALSAQTFDVICAHDWLTATAAFHIGRMFKSPVVITFHDVIFNKVRGREFSIEDAYIAGVEGWAADFSSRVITLSHAVKQELIPAYHIQEEKISVVPGGVAIEPLSQKDKGAVVEWRRSVAEDNQELLLYVGRLDPEKGLFTLVDALRSLSSSFDWRLAIAGQGQLGYPLAARLKEYGIDHRVTFLGYIPQSQLRHAYTAADIVLVPSDYEPFGLVALEAQRMGTPVITSTAGGLSEILSLTRGGIAFPAGHSGKLAEALISLLSDPDHRKTLGILGQNLVTEHYNWNRIAKEIHGVYSLAATQPPPRCSLPHSWSFPSPPTPPEPISDIVIFWDPAASAALDPVLKQLATAQAVEALNSRIVVVGLATENGAEINFSTTNLPRVKFANAKSVSEIVLALKNAAVVVADRRFTSVLKQSQILDSERIPTIWFVPEINGRLPLGDWCVQKLDQLYAYVTKMLCDNTTRRQCAPKLEASIPQISWQPRENTILHVLPQFVTGGAETTLLEIVKGTKTEFTHTVLSFEPVEGPLIAEFQQLGIEILQSTETDAIRKILNLRPAVLHLHSMSYIPSWIRLHRQIAMIPIVETEHVVNIGSGHFGRVEQLICVSKATLNAHYEYMQFLEETRTKIHVIYNGIDTSLYQNLPSKADARKLLGLPSDRPIIGRVSALARNKLPQEALDVIPHILRRIPDAIFPIVGDGPQRPKVQEWIDRQGLSQSVLLLGERRDIPTVLRAFDLFAYYTNKDALGNVILEAIAAGIPVVTTRIEGTPEALGSAPGELVTLGKIDEFSDAVVRWLSPRQPSCGVMHAIDERFTRSFMAKEYHRVYSSLLTKKTTAWQPEIAERQTTANAQFRVLIKFPTRGRPARFFKTLDQYYSMLSNDVPVYFLITCDTDDSSMNNESVRQRLASYPNLAVEFGNHKSKIEAGDAGLKSREFDIVIFAADDAIPVIRGYDKIVMDAMHRYFPSTDGLLHFNDGYRGEELNTQPIFGRHYYDRFGYVCYPGYKSLFADNDFMDVASLLGRRKYIDTVIIRHEHPCNVGKGSDDLYLKNDRYFEQDKNTYLDRKAISFGGLRQRKLVSILVEGRESSAFKRLEHQLAANKRSAWVELLPCKDTESLGSLINSVASGDYICFLDKQAIPTECFLDQIIDSTMNGSADLVAIRGDYILKDESRSFIQAFSREDSQFQTPNHVNPVKRQLLCDKHIQSITDWDKLLQCDAQLTQCNAFIDLSVYFRISPSRIMQRVESPTKPRKRCAVSILIVTNSGLPQYAQRITYLKRLLKSIDLAGFPQDSMEVIVVGAVPDTATVSNYIGAANFARMGLVSHLRNLALDAANGDIIIHCDDDIMFTPGYWEAVSKTLDSPWDILCTRLLNPNGTRYWDWTAYYPGRGQTLLPYDSQDDYVYATGGHGIYRRSFFESIRWCETKCHGENEEYDLAQAAREQKKRFAVCVEASVFLQYHHCDAMACITRRPAVNEYSECPEFRAVQLQLDQPGPSSVLRLSEVSKDIRQPNKYDVSILVMCYRYLNRLKVFLSSVMAQRYDMSKVEVVIANPGSPDGLTEYLNTLKSVFPVPHLREVIADERFRANRGHCIQRAFEASAGTIAIGMDCDLVLPHDFIEDIVRVVNGNPNSVVGVYRNFLSKTTTEEILNGNIDPCSKYGSLAGEDNEEREGYRGVLGYCQAVGRNLWTKVGYPEEFDKINASDVEFVERLRGIGVTPLFQNEIRVLHLNHLRDWTGTKELL